MIKNYLKIAFRNLIKDKLYSGINIIGLALSLTGFILITLYVIGELKYDRFPDNSERVYRVLITYEDDGGTSAKLIADIASILASEFPEFEQIGRVSDTIGKVVIERENIRFNENKVFYAEPAILEIFSFPMIAGTQELALNQPNSVVLTAQTAQKYFGDQNPIGETLILHSNQGENSLHLTVTGVVETTHLDSHFEFDFLISYDSLGEVGIEHNVKGSGWTYTRLIEGVNKDVLEAKIHQQFESMNFSETMELMIGSSKLVLQPLHDIHLYSDIRGEIQPNGNINSVYIFTIVGLLILVVACVNYVNLSTAQSLKRHREVGVRKALGARKTQLAVQFFMESMLNTLIALSLAFVLTELCLPYFNSFMNLSINMDYSLMVPLLFVIAMITWVLAGLYPALFLSSFHPSKALKGISGKGQNSPMYKSLTIFQFFVSAGLVICALIITNQLEFIQNKDLGYQKEHLLTIEIDDPQLRQKVDLFLEELESRPGVLSATAMWGDPTNLRFSLPQTITVDGKEIEVSYLYVYHGFLETMGIDLLEGRDFSQEREGDADRSSMINKAFAERMGWVKSTELQIPTFMGFRTPRNIIGVTDNFHFSSLYEEIGPAIIQVMEPRMLQTALVKINMQNVGQTLEELEGAWSSFQPNRPFSYQFLDEQFAAIYQQEQLLGNMIWFFTVISLLVASIGLLGVTAHYAQLRTKEIGIRKVLGASVANIVALLSKDFVKLVMLGFIIAIPIAWYAMNQWLADFAYRIEIEPGVFVLAGVGALIIALFTVSWQAIKAALANPVESLKSE